MPVGTVGSVKGVHMSELRDDIKAQIILGNTYHLYLRPGLEILRGAGGLHKFNGWEKPILTDSGGFQVFSLASTRKLKEEGVEFRSHLDGSRHLFTPEGTVDIQRVIGADIIMALDECTPGTADKSYAKKSLDMTMRWLHRGWDRFKSTEGLYGYRQTFSLSYRAAPIPIYDARPPRKSQHSALTERHRRSCRRRTRRSNV